MTTTNCLARELLPHAIRMARGKQLRRLSRRYRDSHDLIDRIDRAIVKTIATYDPRHGTKWTTWLQHNLFLQLRSRLKQRKRLKLEVVTVEHNPVNTVADERIYMTPLERMELWANANEITMKRHRITAQRWVELKMPDVKRERVRVNVAGRELF